MRRSIQSARIHLAVAGLFGLALLLLMAGGDSIWSIYAGIAALDGVALWLLNATVFASQPPAIRQGAAQGATAEPEHAADPVRDRRMDPLPVLVLPEQVHLSPQEVIHWSGIATLKEDATFGRTVAEGDRVVHTVTRLTLRSRGRGQLLLTNRRLLLLHRTRPQQILLSSIIAADATWQAVSLLLNNTSHRVLVCVDQPRALADLITRVLHEAAELPAGQAGDGLPWTPGTVVPFTD